MPYPTGRLDIGTFSGHFVPGYDQSSLRDVRYSSDTPKAHTPNYGRLRYAPGVLSSPDGRTCG
jgi:hypothetical protein